jgi:hypothetical protein
MLGVCGRNPTTLEPRRALTYEISVRKQTEIALGVRMLVKFPRLTYLRRLCSHTFVYVDKSMISQRVAFLAQDDSHLQ